MGDSVKISIGMFNQTIDLLESFDTHDLDPVLVCYHKYVLSSFLDKRKLLDLRKSYSKIVSAQDEDERFEARMMYLYEKGNMSD